jgi:hypothetical protein
VASLAFDCLNRYYSDYDEDARLLSKHGQVEFLTTMRYISRNLMPQMRILEIGQERGGIPVRLRGKAAPLQR